MEKHQKKYLNLQKKFNIMNNITIIGLGYIGLPLTVFWEKLIKLHALIIISLKYQI